MCWKLREAGKPCVAGAGGLVVHQGIVTCCLGVLWCAVLLMCCYASYSSSLPRSLILWHALFMWSCSLVSHCFYYLAVYVWCHEFLFIIYFFSFFSSLSLFYAFLCASRVFLCSSPLSSHRCLLFPFERCRVHIFLPFALYLCHCPVFSLCCGILYKFLFLTFFFPAFVTCSLSVLCFVQAFLLPIVFISICLCCVFSVCSSHPIFISFTASSIYNTTLISHFVIWSSFPVFGFIYMFLLHTHTLYLCLHLDFSVRCCVHLSSRFWHYPCLRLLLRPVCVVFTLLLLFIRLFLPLWAPSQSVTCSPLPRFVLSSLWTKSL